MKNQAPRQRPFGIVILLLVVLFITACGPAASGVESSAEDSGDRGEGTHLEDIFASNARDETAMDIWDSAEEAAPDSSDTAADVPLEGDEAEAGEDTDMDETVSETGETAAEGDAISAETAAEADTKEAQALISAETGRTEADANGVEIGFTMDGHAYRGSLAAPVVLEEFSDFQCPYCSRFAAETLPALLENQIANGEVLLIYYDFPLTAIHPQAMGAANAARCAAEQSTAAYWEMHDLLFANPTEWSNANANSVFADYGQSLDLALEPFMTCLADGKYMEEIEADLALGRSRGVRSTPTFFLNDQMFVGAQPLVAFEEAIQVVQGGGELASAPPAESTAPVQPAAVPTRAPVDYETAAAVKGDPDAPIKIVEYTDYQCPYCRRYFDETLPQIVENMVDTGRVFYVLKDLPLESIHPEARAAAHAARCAGEQEAYWRMHDRLFESQESWEGLGKEAQDVFSELALELGLVVADFEACMTDGRYDADIQVNMDEAASFGVNGTPFFFVDGYPINGAQPYTLFEFAIGRAEEGTLAEAYQPNQQQQQQQPPPPPSEPVDVPIADSYSIGDPDAPIVIVEYTDFQCPYCNRHFIETFPRIYDTYVEAGIVRYVFKDFPLTQIHPQAPLAAEAARCAGDQDAFLAMHDLLFANQIQWNGRNNAGDIFTSYAAELELDVDRFSTCLEENQHEAAVEADYQEGVEFGVRGTPTFFINGHFLSGAQPYEVFEAAIAELLGEIEGE